MVARRATILKKVAHRAPHTGELWCMMTIVPLPRYRCEEMCRFLMTPGVCCDTMAVMIVLDMSENGTINGYPWEDFLDQYRSA